MYSRNLTKNLLPLVCLLPIASFAQVGTMPVPQIDTPIVDVTVEIVTGTAPTEYIYRYSVTNPGTSSADLYKFSIDLSSNSSSLGFRRPTLQTYPVQGGLVAHPIQDEEQALRRRPPFHPGGHSRPIGTMLRPSYPL